MKSVARAKRQAPLMRGVVQLPGRWAMSLLACLVLPLGLLFTYPIAPQNGWWWDVTMAVGMLAAGVMIAAPLISSRVWVHFGGDPINLRFILQIHTDASYVVVILVSIHVAGLLVIDPLLIEYLKLSAPWSMLAAIVSAVLLLIITLSSLYRIGLGLRYRNWRRWHVVMSVTAAGLMVFHVVDASFYVNSPLKKAVFVTLAAAPSLAAFGAGGWHTTARAAGHSFASSASSLPLLLPARRGFSARIVALITLLWLVSAIPFAIPTSGSRAYEQANPCPEVVCE